MVKMPVDKSKKKNKLLHVDDNGNVIKYCKECGVECIKSASTYLHGYCADTGVPMYYFVCPTHSCSYKYKCRNGHSWDYNRTKRGIFNNINICEYCGHQEKFSRGGTL